jgi:hypothetical protein
LIVAARSFDKLQKVVPLHGGASGRADT